MKNTMEKDIIKAISAKEYDTAVRMILEINGINTEFLEYDYVYYVDDVRSKGNDLFFFAFDNTTIGDNDETIEYQVNLETQQYRSRINKEGHGWGDWWYC